MPSRDSFCDSIGYKAFIIDEIPSTNTFLKNNHHNYSDKTVLIANKQTMGRGRLNRVWKSDDDICFSILYKNKDIYTIITPLAIVYALKELGIESAIKWPNDIYVNNKKLSGILIEDIYNNSFIASVVGVGINIFDKDEFNGIGLCNFININKNEVILNILKYIIQLQSISQKKLIDLYKRNNMVINKKISYKGKIYYAYDITENGHLVIKNNDETLIVTGSEIDIKNSLL